MGPNTSTLLSLTPLSGAGPDGQNTLQNASELAENPSGEPGALFSQLLSQLIPDEGLDGSVLTENIQILPIETTGEPGQSLPLTGNVLPPTLIPEEVINVTLPEQIETIDIEADAEIDVAAATLAAAPVAPAILQTPVTINLSGNTQPVTTQLRTTRTQATETATPARPLMQIADLPAQENDVELPRAPLIKINNALPIELAATTTQQPVVTTEAPGIAITTTPLATQPLTATATQAKLTLDHPVADARWGESLGQRVIWMTENGMGRAQIRLNPAELGPVEVRIAVANDEAKVAFTVQHGATREAVESALPRLREMFASQGIDLSDASVSQQSPDDQQNAGSTGDSSADSASSEFSTLADSGDAISSGQISISDQLIDTYA